MSENSNENKNEEPIEEECMELKSIKYKTMLLNGNVLQETKSSKDLSNLEKFLEQDKNNNKNENWCKLDKTIKTQKIISFVDKFAIENEFDTEEKNLLDTFLKDCIDRKRLTKVKDVEYDKLTGQIINIPALHYNKSNKHFTLKNLEKKVSTLKSLPPKRNKGTIKNLQGV
jgi:hypothetical protein